jgi:hypothetical protein
LWCYVTAAVVLIYNCCWLALAVGSEGLVGFGFGKIATLFFFLWVEDGGLGPTPFWLLVFVVWGSKAVLRFVFVFVVVGSEWWWCGCNLCSLPVLVLMLVLFWCSLPVFVLNVVLMLPSRMWLFFVLRQFWTVTV